MAFTAQQIIDRAEIILQDLSNERWTESESLMWLNDGQREVVKEKPDANPVIEVVQLTSGSEQSLPASAIQLLDVNCNMGTNGTTEGSQISVVDRKYMDRALPNWRKETQSNVVQHVIYDVKRAPKKYWVYPKSPGTNYIEIITSKLPSDVAAIGNSINIADEYATALMHYVLAMSFSKDAQYNENLERAIAHYNMFLNAVGTREGVEQAINPMKTATVS